jgi:hypothetical protein
MAHPLFTPLVISFCQFPLPIPPCTRDPLTYLESLLSMWCDPRPPWSQVACKLTSPSPFSPHSLFPPPNGFPNSIVRPSKTTSRHRLHLKHLYVISRCFYVTVHFIPESVTTNTTPPTMYWLCI